ncbi:MAG: DUF1460 domain-containing protein [Anaeromyxobacteraceae bacterium]
MLAALLALAALAGPDVSPSGASLPAARPPPDAAIARALATAPAGAARAVAATAPLRGAPYALDALGEADDRDPDPRFRLDAFDCMTFVETAVALGNAASLEEARRLLDLVRYEGPPALASRRHEVLSQWIPQNVAAGWVRDVAAEVAPGAVVREEKVYSREAWALVRRAGRAIPGLPRARLPVGTFAVDVVPLDALAAAAPRIPAGTIAFVVRDDAPDRPSRVSHAGLVFEGPGGERWVRHATSTVGVARVIEEPLSRYVERNRKARPAWRVVGLALVQIADNRARLAEALAHRPAPGVPARVP